MRIPGSAKLVPALLLALLAAAWLAPVSARAGRLPARRAVYNGLTLEDDRSDSLPVPFMPRDAYIVEHYSVCPKPGESNGFYQIFDEVHLDGDAGRVLLVSADAASNVLWQTVVSDLAGRQSSPVLGFFGDGTPLAAWESTSAGTNNVNLWCMRYSASGSNLWALPCPLSAAPGNQTACALATARNGNVLALWEDGRGGSEDIYFQELRPDGSPAYRPDGVAVERSQGAQRHPGFETGSNGWATALFWQDYKDLPSPICTVRIRLENFSAPEGAGLAALLLAALCGRRRLRF